MKNKELTRIALLAATAALLPGCSDVQTQSNEIKAATVQPAPDAGFIPHPERQTQHAGLPFQKVWIKPGFDKADYKALIVASVDTRYMLEMDWLHKMSSATWVSDVKKDVAELAQYFHDQVETEFRNDPNHRFQVVQQPGQTRLPALRLELALVEIDPSQPVLHALSWAGPPEPALPPARSTSAAPPSKAARAM